MFALTVLLILVAYLLISLGVILAARATARRKGRRPWLWGWVAAIAMYHLVFWDLIPTAILYRYYQSREAGLWIYKSKDQWLADNSGVASTLTYKDISRRSSGPFPYAETLHLNQRLNAVEKRDVLWPHISRVEYLLVDVSANHVLVRGVYFQSGDCSTQLGRFWIQRCEENTQVIQGRFFRIADEFKKLGSLEK